MLYEDNYLAHFGIKGQKWGVRRFQNEDGSLTDAGKARLVKKAGSYLPDKHKELLSTKGSNRRHLAEEYSEDDADRTYKEQKKKYDSLKDKWASATLKDLGLKDTAAGRRDVKAVLKDTDPNYSYRKRYPYSDSDVYSESELASFRERKKKIAHPTKEKIKRGVAKAKDAINTVAAAKKLFPGG